MTKIYLNNYTSYPNNFNKTIPVRSNIQANEEVLVKFTRFCTIAL